MNAFSRTIVFYVIPAGASRAQLAFKAALEIKLGCNKVFTLTTKAAGMPASNYGEKMSPGHCFLPGIKYPPSIFSAIGVYLLPSKLIRHFGQVEKPIIATPVTWNSVITIIVQWTNFSVRILS